MASTVKVLQSVTYGSKVISNTTNHTVENVQVIEETVADGSTDLAILCSIDVSAAKVVSIMADQDLTIETNDGTTPQETISLTANLPIVWQTGDAALFAGDVDSIYVTNASGSSTVLQMIIGSDLP